MRDFKDKKQRKKTSTNVTMQDSTPYQPQRHNVTFSKCKMHMNGFNFNDPFFGLSERAQNGR